MAFTYVLTTDIGKVRLLINDTTEATAHYTDAEIEVFLDLVDDSIKLAAALALEAWAASLYDSMLSEKIGDYSYSKKSADNMLAIAQRLREAEASEPVSDWASFDLTEGSGITAEGD